MLPGLSKAAARRAWKRTIANCGSSEPTRRALRKTLRKVALSREGGRPRRQTPDARRKWQHSAGTIKAWHNAEEFMQDPVEEAGQLAVRYLEGAASDAKQVLASRKQLRSSGHPALARALSRKLAERFIAGAAIAMDDVDELWKACKADEAFSHGRRVLRRRRFSAPNVLPAPAAYQQPTPQTLREQAALMTSKDPDLAAFVRHDWALTILQPDLQESSAETLGIAGGIWKRKWEMDGNTSSLERALQHYLAPVERNRSGTASDQQHDQNGAGVTALDGYPAINAAFVCDVLASQMKEDESRRTYALRAANLRRRICHAVKGDSYWVLVTLGEAHFGLGDMDHAVTLLAQAAAKEADPWERATTARQLARLGAIRNMQLSDVERVVAALVGTRGDAWIKSVLIGKVGLGLSGGGFRASLYHLGVLARLAESDVLRHVEVLSTVSGGSMVGAAYYLRLRHLLETNGAPARGEYVALVRDLIEDFRVGTNANLRSSLLMDLRVCHAILSGSDDVYTAALAENVFKMLYSRTVSSDPHMAELSIHPLGAEQDFHPRYHNLDRHAKVPALSLNATTLNTGHSWQFTTTSMGESPFSIVTGADALPRLRRAYYRDERGSITRGVTLSQAVTASACVPGLFAPLAIGNLYDQYNVRLVDGGVYDNQAALALQQEDCTVLIVSDACGQLGLDTNPGGGHVPPLMRSVGIFQERMRQSSFANLRAAKEHGRICGLAYVHMKKDLEVPPVDWIGCEDPSRDDDQLPATITNNPTTSYGVWKEHQALLAGLRTDLDVFSDIEAAALMASGYMAMDTELKSLVAAVPSLDAPRNEENWFFTQLIPRLRGKDVALTRHLESGSDQFLRVFKLDRRVRAIALAATAFVLLMVLLAIWGTWQYEFRVSVGSIVLALGVIAAPFVGRYVLGDWGWTFALIDPMAIVRRRAVRWAGAIGTWMLARFLVPRLTKRYLDAGRLDRLASAR
jgi:predicted acylesterase/phospholipase RssA